MALNPQYFDIGKEFVTQYYAIFDDPNTRHNLVNLYNVSIEFVFSFKYFILKLWTEKLHLFV